MGATTKVAAAVGLCLTGWLAAAPLAAADPGAGPVAVTCQVYSMGYTPGFGSGMPGGLGMPQWVGSVTGHGADFGEARSDAECQKWGPFGMAPELRDCVPVGA